MRREVNFFGLWVFEWLWYFHGYDERQGANLWKLWE